MSEAAAQAEFIAVLDRLAERGAPARLWIRDDDAGKAVPALSRFLDIAAQSAVSPLVAAIPSQADESLARILEPYAVSVAVHGLAHVNHALAGEKPAELGPHRPVRAVLADLALARERLARVAGGRLLPILVPPWNRIAKEVIRHLPLAGFSGLSTFGWRRVAQPVPGLTQVNTHLDLIDWRGTRGSWPREMLFNMLTRAMTAAAETGTDEPIGVLCHHGVHDAAAWEFLQDLFSLTRAHPGAHWQSPAAAFAAQSPEHVSATQPEAG